MASRMYQLLACLSLVHMVFGEFGERCAPHQSMAHPSSCSSFILCDKEGNPHLFQCPEGLHYSVKKSCCDWPESAHCESQVLEQTYQQEQEHVDVSSFDDMGTHFMHEVPLEQQNHKKTRGADDSLQKNEKEQLLPGGELISSGDETEHPKSGGMFETFDADHLGYDHVKSVPDTGNVKDGHDLKITSLENRSGDVKRQGFKSETEQDHVHSNGTENFNPERSGVEPSNGEAEKQLTSTQNEDGANVQSVYGGMITLGYNYTKAVVKETLNQRNFSSGGSLDESEHPTMQEEEKKEKEEEEHHNHEVGKNTDETEHSSVFPESQ